MKIMDFRSRISCNFKMMTRIEISIFKNKNTSEAIATSILLLFENDCKTATNTSQ